MIEKVVEKVREIYGLDISRLASRKKDVYALFSDLAALIGYTQAAKVYKEVGIEPPRRLIIAKASVIGEKGVGKTSLCVGGCNKVREGRGALWVATRHMLIGDSLLELALLEQDPLQLVHSCIRGSSTLILVFDLSNRRTFEFIKEWAPRIANMASNALLVLVGNKADLEREVERDEAEELARELGAAYFETSAKTGENIDTMFEYISKQILSNINSYNVIVREICLD